MLIDNVIQEMKEVFYDSPNGIVHTFDVQKYTEAIMAGENFTKEEKEMISITAILHDIGIPEAKRKYGSSEAKYQEKEGAIIAKVILEKIGYHPVQMDRVCYIVGNHHTVSKIDGLDFQIIWEADLLVNLEKNNLNKEELKKCIEDNFKTEIGRKIAYEKYIVE